jgi:transposase
MSGTALDGRLFLTSARAALRQLGRGGLPARAVAQNSQKLLVIWDGTPIHQVQAVKAFLTGGVAKRLHLEQLPGYAPDGNPDEGIWSDLKRVELANGCAHDLVELRRGLPGLLPSVRL